MVCRSICLSVCHNEPCKTAEPIEMPLRSRTRVGPRNRVLVRGPDLPMERGNFEGAKGRPIVKYRDTAVICAKRLNRSRCCLGYGLGWPKESCVLWGPVPPWEWAIFGNGSPIVKYSDFLSRAVRKRLNRSICVWVVDWGGPKEAQVQSYSPGDANVPFYEANKIQPSVCGGMRPYVKLL